MRMTNQKIYPHQTDLRNKEREENKSYESSSKVSIFPAVHVDCKDALKNILSIPSKSSMKSKKL